ncbi:GCN5-related N-acetyltransferase [Paenibacillus pasadenensis]|uniref:GCN5-related N-acetyltransferase n=1 Tax=Paenibacillus pasadenensis TaxID=217090 RepID=A0A2N5N7N1_9BACL|nr:MULTISPECIES: GNAT family N-acetyltransferase [Paenibacillus]PLT46299.1 GCN5-related N-acetyltransferase [Paenibacillus pasadenensis]QGG56745.1 GNAT family N-acetyltransferase [Paenibacillus sp. B01]
MLQSFLPGDGTLEQKAFVREETAFNLIHTISAAPESRRLRSGDGRLVFAQSPGRNGWLWLSPELEPPERERLLGELDEALADELLPGVSGSPDAAPSFAARHGARTGRGTRVGMVMEAYAAPALLPPTGVSGRMRLFGSDERELAAEFLAGMVRDVYGELADAAGQLATADTLIRAAKLYLWEDGGEPSAMAGYGGASPRHGRINAVYTPPDRRRKGYGSALVAGVAGRIAGQGLVPMLYADCAYPDSNRVYRRLGFQPAGVIADIKFA